MDSSDEKEVVLKTEGTTALNVLLMAHDVTGDGSQPLSHRKVVTILSNLLVRSHTPNVVDFSSLGLEKKEEEKTNSFKTEKEIEGDTVAINKDLEEAVSIVVKKLGDMGVNVGNKRICQYAFTQNDIVWICKTCQVDETCVLCNQCFIGSNHSGHEVFFYRTLSGGCCDCGDPEAWNENGFCKDHGAEDGTDDPLASLAGVVASSGKSIVNAIVSTLKELVSEVKFSYTVDALGNGYESPKIGQHRHDKEDPYVLVFHNNEMTTAEDFQHLLFIAARAMEADPDIKTNVLTHEVVNRLHVPFTRGHEETEISVPHSVDHINVVRLFKRLTGKPFCFSISVRGRRLVARYRRASTLLSWMLALSRTCSAFSHLVADRFDESTLEQLMLCDAYFPATLRQSLHDLYLELMANQPFKKCIALAYARTLIPVTKDYAKGIGRADSCLNCLSVQFMNRKLFVDYLIEERGQQNSDFLADLCNTILITLCPTLKFAKLKLEDGTTTKLEGFHDSPWGGSEMDQNHPVLSCRRYHPAVADLRCILNVEDVPRQFITICFPQWMSILRVLQNIGGQRRVPRARGHVPFTSRDWIHVWNICTSICMQFEQALSWMRDASADYSVCGLQTCTGLFCEVLSVFEEMHSNQEKALQHRARSLGGGGRSSPQLLCTLPLKSVNERLALRPPPSQRTFHPIMHRFLAAAVREACRPPNTKPLEYLQQNMREKGSTFITWFLDAPLLTLELCSEIVAGIWLRNGFSMKDQVVNYQELPFCRYFRDLDVLAVQVAGVICGSRCLVNHILHRYRCWHFFHSGELDRGLTWSCSSDTISTALDIDQLPLPGERRSSTELAELDDNDELLALLSPPINIFAEPSQHLDEIMAEVVQGGDSSDGEEGVVTTSTIEGNEEVVDDSDVQGHEHTVAMDESNDDESNSDNGAEERLVVEEDHMEGYNIDDSHVDDTLTADIRTQQGLRNRRGSDDISPGRLDVDQQQALGVECLILFIRLISEVPSPPDVESSENGNGGANTNSNYVLNQLRREVLHILACGPATHSELAEISSLLGQMNVISEGKLDEILDEIANVVEGGSLLEPGKFVLKSEFYVEYDPGFWHISLAGHQKALERREESCKARDPSLFSPMKRGKSESRRRLRPVPMCPPLRPVHPFFKPFRIGLATEEALLLALKRPFEEGEASGPSAALSCALHLLTLAVYIVIDVNDSVTTVDPEEGGSSSGADLKDATCDSAITSQFCNTLLDTGIVKSLVSLSTKGLLDCDFTTLSGVNWVLQQLYRMHDGFRTAIPESFSDAEEKAKVGRATASGASSDKRSESARARVLAALREQAAKFEAENKEGSMDEVMGEEKIDTAEDTVSPPCDFNVVQCIVCHEMVTRAAFVKQNDERFGSRSALIGRVAFIQRSAVLGGPERPGLHVQSCGHALHQECFNQYFDTVAEQQEAGRVGDPETSMALDLSKREFKCPMCKAVANSFVPWAPLLQSDQPPPHKLTSNMNASFVPANAILEWIKSRFHQPLLTLKADEGIQGSSTGDNLVLARSDTNGAMVDDEKQAQQPSSRSTDDDRSTSPSCGAFLFQGTAQTFLLNLREVEGSGASSPFEFRDVCRAASATAYTASSLLAELKACLPGGGDETKRAIGATLLFECLRVATQQPLMSEKLHATLLLILENGCADAGNSGSSSPSKNHISPLPLLEHNLLEILVLLFCVLPEEGWALALTTLCVARGVQVCLAVNLQQQRCIDPSATWMPSGSLKDSMLGRSGDNQDHERVKRLDKCLKDSLVPFAQVAHLLVELLSCKDVMALQAILNNYRQEGLLQYEINAENSQNNAAASDAEGVSRTSLACSCPSSVSEMRKLLESPWDGIIRSWVNAALTYHRDKQSIASSNMLNSIINHQGDWPSAVAPKLHNLPQSYTELHSQLNTALSNGQMVNPALCLSCGSIGPARSAFYISHAKTCGLGCGIFFLQKECTTLLVNQAHVMLYASPYVVRCCTDIRLLPAAYSCRTLLQSREPYELILPSGHSW